MQEGYLKDFKRSVDNPEEFWGEQAKNVHWFEPPTSILDTSNPPITSWFGGGKCNVCYQALDVHVESGRGGQVAMIYDSPVTGTARKITYAEFLSDVKKFAEVLVSKGVKMGDTVVIYMPMIPETAVAMLACARIGATHSVVFGGFAAPELATRINALSPKVIVSASCGVEVKKIVEYKKLLDTGIELSEPSARPSHCIIVQRPEHVADLGPIDLSWADEMAAVTGENSHCVPVPSNHPLYVLHTSGTTDLPKGIVRDHGGYMVALKWTMTAVYNIQPGEVWWSASDYGWVVGHSYIVYGPLFHGATTVLYEGKPVDTPDAGAFWRMISQYKIVTLFTAPTTFRAIKQRDPECSLIKNYDMSSFRALFLAGERCDPNTIQWAEQAFGGSVPVLDHWWQTETGWSITAACLHYGRPPTRYGSAFFPVPGWNVRVLADPDDPDAEICPDAQEVPPNTMGNIVVKLPLPPGAFLTLWKNEEFCHKSYFRRFPGYYNTCDAGFIDSEGYVHVMARTDDVINVAAHRLSSGEMEGVLANHPKVAESAVIGLKDPIKGQVPVAIVVVKAGVVADADGTFSTLCSELKDMIRTDIGPIASLSDAVVVAKLPKTRSGKVLRGTLRKIGDGLEYRMPPTIEDPQSLLEIEKILTAIREARKCQ